MANQVSNLIFESNVTTNANVKTWLDGLTIASVIGAWQLPLSNTKVQLILAYKDA